MSMLQVYMWGIKHYGGHICLCCRSTCGGSNITAAIYVHAAGLHAGDQTLRRPHMSMLQVYMREISGLH